MAVLLIDQGNTAAKFQIRNKNGDVLQDTQRIANLAPVNANADIKNYFKSEDISHIAVASVAKADAKIWLNELLAGFSEPVSRHFAQTQLETSVLGLDIKNSYQDPSQMGVDRWMAIIAGSVLYPRQPVVVVDAGSAVTVELIAENSVHLGGYIIPGISTMLNSLYQGTGQVKVESKITISDSTPGSSTAECVNNGIVSAVVGLIERSIQLLEKRVDSTDVTLVVAGGGACMLVPHLSKSVDIQPDLVLDGLFHWFSVNCT